MKFVRADDLKIGMRLARPIYSKKGVLLFERSAKLTFQAIESVHNFGLLGVYILEPAEPVPPMTKEDVEFERFQTMAIFSIREELERILFTRRQNKILTVASMIIKNYGQREGRINFYQSLRSREDYVYKHSLNVAILCALMAHSMRLTAEEQQQIVLAAIIHDIGKVPLVKTLIDGDEQTDETRKLLSKAQLDSLDLIEGCFSDGEEIRRICMQAQRAQEGRSNGVGMSGRMVRGAKVLLAANRYDEITAMKLDNNTDSEVKAIQEFRDRPLVYSPEVTTALEASVNILYPGVSVELSNGLKAVVLAENAEDVLRPMVLTFKDNSVIDLALKKNSGVRVVDIMKTLDNRCIMDTETLRRAGYPVKEPELMSLEEELREKRLAHADD